MLSRFSVYTSQRRRQSFRSSAKDDFFLCYLYTHAIDLVLTCAVCACACLPCPYPQTLTPVNLVDFHKSSERAVKHRLLLYPVGEEKNTSSPCNKEEMANICSSLKGAVAMNNNCRHNGYQALFPALHMQ